jgi:hypothetical protein
VLKEVVLKKTETAGVSNDQQEKNAIEQKLKIESINTDLDRNMSDEIKKFADVHTDNEQALMKAYGNMIKSGKPLVLSLSYDADCCEGTKRFYIKYNSLILELFAQYQGKVNTFFFNAGKINEKQQKEMMEIAQKINLEKGFPILILLDSKGSKKQSLIGEFDIQSAKKSIEGLLP